MQRLIALQQAKPPGAVACLRGNHEQLCLDALAAGGGWQLNLWLRNGGATTLASYGGSHDADGLAALPEHHRTWLAGLPFLHHSALRIFVHAGLSPYTALADQDPETCLWIKEGFLRAPVDSFPAHVVHGHTPCWADRPHTAQPERLVHNTNLDTGSYMTGVLTAAAFDHRRPGPSAILTLQSAAVASLTG